MLRLLSLETATDQGAFALWSGEVTAAEIRVQSFKQFCCPAGQPHAETLLPALRIALNELDWSLASIDAIVFDAGPGMFTGLRVSAALAQGLAIALNKPVIPVCSLEVLAEASDDVPLNGTGGTKRISGRISSRFRKGSRSFRVF